MGNSAPHPMTTRVKVTSRNIEDTIAMTAQNVNLCTSEILINARNSLISDKFVIFSEIILRHRTPQVIMQLTFPLLLLMQNITKIIIL